MVTTFNAIPLLILTLLYLPPKTLISNNRHSIFTEASGLIEHERQEEYHKRNYTWPPRPDEYVPDTEGWRRIMERRLERVQRIEDGGDMYNGECSVMQCAVCIETTNNTAIRQDQNSQLLFQTRSLCVVIFVTC